VLDQAIRLISNDLSIDLGTCNTLVHVAGRGVVVEEPSVVAISKAKSGSQVVAFGLEAKRMLGRTPQHINTAYPIEHSAVNDFPMAAALLDACIQRALGRKPMIGPRVVIPVGRDLEETKRRGIADLARAVGCRDVILVDSLMAAAKGCELAIGDPVGNCVVDIGGSTTRAGVITLGGIAASASITTGGNAIDRAIVDWIKTEHQVLVGARTAEELKMFIGSAIKPSEVRETQVTGRDINEGIPREVTISNSDVYEAIQIPLQTIVGCIQQALSKTPPELAADIHDHGILLCGGGSLLVGMAEYLRQVTKLPILVPEDPRRCIAAGANQLLTDATLLKRARLQ